MELETRQVAVAGRTLEVRVPPDPEALIDERAFERDEFLPYWAELWPSAFALAEALAAARPAGRMLELGCGLGIPSMVAALDGADVLATDWSAEAVELLRDNADRVGARLRVERFGWTADPAALGEPWPLVVAADVLYERRHAPWLLSLLPRVVAPGGEVWIADPGRAAAPAFFEAAEADGWAVAGLPHAGPATVALRCLALRTPSASPG